MTADLIAKRLRHHAATLRTNSLPLSDLIPLLCQAADALDTQSPAEGAGCDRFRHPLYAGVKCGCCGRKTDPQPKGMCRVRAASQPCDCPVATCNLWRGGLRPADAAEKLRAAHDESLDDKHQSCRSMLLEVVADLEEAPAPSPAPAMHSTALAGLILTHLGYSTEPSLEPGADMRREALASRLDEWLSPATPCAAPAHERVKRWAEQHHVSFVSRSHGLAMNEAEKYGLRTDDKLIRKALNDAERVRDLEWLAQDLDRESAEAPYGLEAWQVPATQAPAVGAQSELEQRKLDYARALDAIKSHAEYISLLEQKMRELQAFKDAVELHQRGGSNSWYWLDDRENYLETMVASLPVVIRAEQLRALLAPAVVTDHVNAMRMALEALEKAYGWNATTPMLDTAITGLRDALASQPPVQQMGGER